MKNIKTLLAITTATVCVAGSSSAEFSRYWEIGGADFGQPSVIHAAASTTSLGPSMPGDMLVPFWQFRTAGQNGRGEFQRYPLAMGDMAFSFTLTANAYSTAYLEIEAPNSPPLYPGNEWSPQYLFGWSISLPQPGMSAGWIDALGTHTLASTPGYWSGNDAQWNVKIEAVGTVYGFWVVNNSPQPYAALQIMNWRFTPPELKMQNAVVLSWPVTEGQFVLETASNVDGPWQDVPDPWSRVNDGRYEVSVLAPDSQRFFRLRAQ